MYSQALSTFINTYHNIYIHTYPYTKNLDKNLFTDIYIYILSSRQSMYRFSLIGLTEENTAGIFIKSLLNLKCFKIFRVIICF